MRWHWLLGLAVSLGFPNLSSAQIFHKQRYSSEPCCPAVPMTQPPLVDPKGEPIPPPKGVEPMPPMAEAAPLPMSSDFAPDTGGESLSTFDSSVGYIDSAIPANIFRLRVDASYYSNRATRAEFLYAAGPPGPGLPLPELVDDFQEIMAYAEGTLTPNLSVFVEAPVRFINPEINENHAGFGDMNFGFKYALLYCPDSVASFQFRTWVPTGDSHDGLGNDHVSLEPSLLFYQRLSDRLRMEGELRYWIPIGGTEDFAGNIVRYGIGFSYGERPPDDIWITPVVELVGWTVLDGLVAVTPPLNPPVIEDAGGDTIINIKLGARIGLGDIADFYTGYGRALTGDVWYKEIWRTELRFAF